MRDKIIRQLEKQDLDYNDLNKIQMYLINHSYAPIISIVFHKSNLYEKKSVFYFNDEKELREYIEKGNGKTNRRYCQIYNESLYFYTFNGMKDIILNYTLYDSLKENNKNIVEWLIKNFELDI